MSLAVISMYFIPSLIYKVQIFQEEMGIYFPNYQMNHARDFLISCLLAICIYITKLYTHKQVLKHYGPILQKKYSGTNLELRLYKINASWMKFLFFTCTSIYAQYALQFIPSHSPSLHGTGNYEKTYVDFPFVHNPWQLRLYYVLGLSYHLENTVGHLMRVPQNDFYEMLLHHSASVMLITFSYLSGFTHVGI